MKITIQSTKVTFPVKVAESRIPNAGKGLFAIDNISKNAVICTYGGTLIDAQDARYADPMYMVDFENGRGYKMIGDDSCGDVGIYANAIHPALPNTKQNARLDMRNKKYLANNRGVIDIVARQDILAGDEIVVCYGDGYWATMNTWNTTPHPVKSASDNQRDDRAKRRRVCQL